MQFVDVVRARRSVRAFGSEPGPETVIRELLQTACLAPSGQYQYSFDRIEPSTLCFINVSLDSVQRVRELSLVITKFFCGHQSDVWING